MTSKPPLTDAERQQRRREKKSAAGLSEVRGIWAPKEHHDTIRAKAIAHANRLRKDKR